MASLPKTALIANATGMAKLPVLRVIVGDTAKRPATVITAK